MLKAKFLVLSALSKSVMNLDDTLEGIRSQTHVAIEKRSMLSTSILANLKHLQMGATFSGERGVSTSGLVAECLLFVRILIFIVVALIGLSFMCILR